MRLGEAEGLTSWDSIKDYGLLCRRRNEWMNEARPYSGHVEPKPEDQPDWKASVLCSSTLIRSGSLKLVCYVPGTTAEREFRWIKSSNTKPFKRV